MSTFAHALFRPVRHANLIVVALIVVCTLIGVHVHAGGLFTRQGGETLLFCITTAAFAILLRQVLVYSLAWLVGLLIALYRAIRNGSAG